MAISVHWKQNYCFVAVVACTDGQQCAKLSGEQDGRFCVWFERGVEDNKIVIMCEADECIREMPECTQGEAHLLPTLLKDAVLWGRSCCFLSFAECSIWAAKMQI